jgi:hypothetical protein
MANLRSVAFTDVTMPASFVTSSTGLLKFGGSTDCDIDTKG